MKPSFWKRFRFFTTECEMFWMTPVFAIWISSGGLDPVALFHWWGMRLGWGFRRQVPEGECYFLHEKDWIMRRQSMFRFKGVIL